MTRPTAEPGREVLARKLWMEEFKCGCTNVVRFRSECFDYCPTHGQDRRHLHRIKGHYLVTNNHPSRDTHGRMSHLWLTDFIQKSSRPQEDGEFICYTEFDRKIRGLTHFCEVFPLSIVSLDAARKAEAGEVKNAK